jgi:hypothetical protein
MSHHSIKYTAVGRGQYAFTFSWIETERSWRVYIDVQPSYGLRSKGAVETHRLGLPSRPYICWTTSLRSYEDARAVAALWADSTQHYIATGQFTPPPNRPTVVDRSTCGQLTEPQLRIPRPAGQTDSGRRGPIRRLWERLG